MDWLLTRQDRIQAKLAARHLAADGLVLYDLSSSDFEGTTCPLARQGYSRGGRRGTLQVNYGLMTDDRGCPVAVTVHEGNTGHAAGNAADPTTLMPKITRIKNEFGITQFVMVGDRGMIRSTAIATLREHGGIDWITALKSPSIRALVEDKSLQPDLSLPAAWPVDETDLCEITHPDYPGERLVACRNPELAKLRRHKRAELLQATEDGLIKIATRVAAGRLTGQDKIGVAVGRIVNRYKMAKPFTRTITDTTFAFARKEDAISTILRPRTSRRPCNTTPGAPCSRPLAASPWPTPRAMPRPGWTFCRSARSPNRCARSISRCAFPRPRHARPPIARARLFVLDLMNSISHKRGYAFALQALCHRIVS